MQLRRIYVIDRVYEKLFMGILLWIVNTEILFIVHHGGQCYSLNILGISLPPELSCTHLAPTQFPSNPSTSSGQ